jgi:MFS family permease
LGILKQYDMIPATHKSLPQRLPFYYGWINVIAAAAAMTATLPGRTHGLGLITKKLLEDLQISETRYGEINLATALLGALFCIPIGSLIDRVGVRAVATGVSAGLGVAVLAMAAATGPLSLFVTLLAVRGLGQSALSVVSMAIVGKWFGRRLGMAMGVYSVLLTIGFAATVPGTGYLVEVAGWRTGWNSCALALLAGMAPLAWLLVRDDPASCGVSGDVGPSSAVADNSSGADFTLRDALSSPAFWVFALGTSMFNLVWSAVTLWNELILEERGFNASAAIEVMTVLTASGLISNLAAGAIARRGNLGRLLAFGLVVLAISLALFPRITSIGQLRLYAVAMGLTGGIVTVVFFAAWRHLFGAAHLGRIQGAAQLITVLASSVGPLLMAQSHEGTGSYTSMFYLLAAVVGVLSLAAAVVPLPVWRRERAAAEGHPWAAAESLGE